MTRGNQRDLARAKNLKKQEKLGKGKDKETGSGLEKRKERDADIMRQKQAAKAAKKADEPGASGGK